ncbi:MAG: chromosome segregation protein SMC [Sedimentisphaerales bacterium]|jgi:chromosome segregation protein
MRLEKVILDGFKSFADKTEFVFPSPITGIVGPNGCGKSNVVDAVKWVFGEQSAKSLRSGHMADVVFGGSASRKPAGCAEVSLFLSNTDGSATGRLPIETDEVQITRRIYRSGDSEYMINNKGCRLKDIRELFMDTGVGVRAYSIIEQGQVERLLMSSPIERRTIFEEAAGVSKYKAHKEEALRKLERTEQNLLRLADILSEVAGRLRSVKLAAGKARNYVQYTQRLKELQVNYSLAEFDKIFKTTAQKKAALDEAEALFAAAAAEVAKYDALLGQIGQQIIETENDINRTDNSLVAVQSKIEQHLQRIEFLRSRIKELEQRKAAGVERAQKLTEQKNAFTTDLERYKVLQQENDKSLEQCSRDVEQTSRTVAEINTRCASLETELEDEKSGIIDIVRHTAQLHNELQSISGYRTNLSSQKDRLAGRAQVTGAELEKLLTEKAQCDARLRDIEAVISDLTKNLDAKREESETCAGRIDEDKKRLANSKEAKSALASELAVLTDMENRREGVKAGAKRILENASRFDYVEGILADVITASIDYAAAVEAALEDKTDAVVITSTAKLLAGKSEIDSLDGRVHFISADKISPFVDNTDLSAFSAVKGRLVEFVNYQPKHASLVWSLLGKTLVVDSIDCALSLAEQIGSDYKFVTLKGEFASGDGFVKLGPLGRAAGLISRKSRLRQLQDTIANITGEINALENQIDTTLRTSEHLAKLCKDFRTAVYEANTEKTQIGSRLAALEENIKRLRDEQPLIAGEIDMLEKQIAQSVEQEYQSKQKLQELEAVNNERNARISQLQNDYSGLKEQQQTLVDKLTDLKVSMGQISEHRQSLIQTIQSLQAQLQANTGAVGAAESEIKSCTEQAASAQADILACEAAVSELFGEKDTTQQNSSQLHKQIEEMLAEQKNNEQLLRDKRAGQTQVEQQINELKIELGQLDVKQQDLIARVRDELQIDLLQSYTNYQDSAVDWEKVREEIAELRGKIERLGNVNLDAIQEQDDLEQRHNFLSTQVEDLNSSKGQLQQLINRLNKVSRERFAETFEQIRGHFQQIFRKLFGGGKADIVLEEAPDILDAGIEIIAKPPGKETRSISLLSGGEKTMTAISLLFAVFKTKPSPFCFLDEVDAALDEANNERFDMLLKEFQKDSQFVVITHSKRTMSTADMLYGITMQTQGVSKKIAVNFDHYVSEPAAA